MNKYANHFDMLKMIEVLEKELEKVINILRDVQDESYEPCGHTRDLIDEILLNNS